MKDIDYEHALTCHWIIEQVCVLKKIKEEELNAVKSGFTRWFGSN